jgi:hypothetical protein
MWISHFKIMCLKWPSGIGDLFIGTTIKLFFLINICMLECLFLWYLSDLDLWLSVMSCGVMSTITSAYIYRKKMLIKVTRQIRLSLIKKNVYSLIDSSHLKRFYSTLIDLSYRKRFYITLISYPNHFAYLILE